MKRILAHLIVFFPLMAAAQFTPEFSAKLKVAVEKKINGLRVEKKLSALTSDGILDQAATYHSIYQRDHDTLTHDEKTPGYFTPTARVRKFGGGDFEIVGENVLFTVVREKQLKPAIVDSLAQVIATAWRNSPKHYANILNKKFVFGSLGFGYNSQTGKLYATQVFGKRGVRIENQLSTNAFGITKAEKKCSDQLNTFSNLIYNLGNGVTIFGHQVVLSESDKSLFNHIWNSDKDGIAIDLVRRSQFPCGKENQLDLSPVYDGILLKPEFKKEVLANNYAESDYRYIGVVGAIPENLNPSDYEPSIVLLNEGQACEYIYPVYVPRGQLEPIKYEPELEDPKNVMLEKTGVIESRVVPFNFNTNDTLPLKWPTIAASNYRVHSVDIQTYASVDGDSANNVLLQTARAAVIQRYLSGRLKISNEKIRSDARENWDLMKYQLRYYGEEDLANAPTTTIRTEYRLTALPLKEMFAEQRKSVACIQYEGTLGSSADSAQIAELNLRTGLTEGNKPIVLKALAILCRRKKIPDFIFSEPYFSLIRKEPAYVQNFAALLCLQTDKYRNEIARCINDWAATGTSIPEGGRRNLLYLYSLSNADILRIWDLAASRLQNILSPERLYPIREITTISNQVLLFDMHLTFIYYFGQINKTSEISKSFDFLMAYLDKNNIPLSKHKELALFCNNWSMYHLSVKRLKNCLDKGIYDKESVMILLQTSSFYREDFDEKSYKKVLDLAKKIAPADFCKWVNGNFQVLRNDDLKLAYCQICNKQ